MMYKGVCARASKTHDTLSTFVSFRHATLLFMDLTFGSHKLQAAASLFSLSDDGRWSLWLYRRHERTRTTDQLDKYTG